ncbi:MAG TPA: hypothetical protein VFR97_09230 [Capillimicrobium sp.]|nr:hypothetical protein [Capillimicrobium sp.]
MPRHGAAGATAAAIGQGAGGGLVAGGAAAATLALIAEISAASTAMPGIRSSTWTPLTAVAAVAFGPDAFHGSFRPLPIAGGLAILLAVAALLGIAGTAWIVVCAGPAPSAPLAVALGVAFGVAAEVAVVNAAVTAIDPDAILYDALPSWGWWVAIGVYGAALGLLSARRGSRR